MELTRRLELIVVELDNRLLVHLTACLYRLALLVA